LVSRFALDDFREAEHRMRRGYTLFEMIIVCALLLIVAGLSIPSIESMYSDSKMQAAVDQVRGAWAGIRSHAISEGQSYRFSVAVNGSDFRAAPDGSEYWGGGDPPASADANNPPMVKEGSLPRGIRFTADASDPGSADASTSMASSAPSTSSGSWSTVAVFLPDGTAQQDVEIIFRSSEAGATPISLKLRALTGGVTTRRLSASAGGH
jgi:prepilin-type N-terminal cleavage/methylation domain-containing protein